MSLRCSPFDYKLEGVNLAHDTTSAADWTFMLDCLALASAFVALNLNLLKYSRRKLMFLNNYSVASTMLALIHQPICTTTTVTFVTNLLFFKLEFCRMAVVEITERNSNPDFHIWPASFPCLVTKVPITAKKSREHIKWVMMVTTTTLLPLFQALMSILVVDLAALGVGESFICFCDLYELFLRFFIPSEYMSGVFLHLLEGCPYGFLSGWNFLLITRYALLISRSEQLLSKPRSFTWSTCVLAYPYNYLLCRNLWHMLPAAICKAPKIM